MEFKDKLKVRRNLAIAFMALGIVMLAAAWSLKIDNHFISGFGLGMAVIGLARLRQHRLITRSEESMRRREIAETDERNILLIDKARSLAFIAYVLLSGGAVIVLTLLGLHGPAGYIAYSVCLLALLYWLSYLIVRKKY